MRVSILVKLVVSFLVVGLVPLAVVGYISLQDAKDIGYGAAKDAENLGKEAVADTSEAITGLVGDSFLKLAKRIVKNIQTELVDRENDAVAMANILSVQIGSTDQIKDTLLALVNAKKEEWWYNTGTDLEPNEQREMLPTYSEAAFINAEGTEVVKIVDGRVTDDLSNVSNPKNTTYKSETYFKDTKKLKRGEVYVSRVNTWYTSTDEARKGVPKNSTAWDIIPGRDIMKKGNLRFASPIYAGNAFKGIVVLSLDYRHLQSITKHIDPAVNETVVSTSYEGNYILMYDDKGDTIVHPKPNNIRGYLPDGQLEHRNTAATPGGIFNLQKFDKSKTYGEIYDLTIKKGNYLIKSAVDVKGRQKMTISVPVPYSKGEYVGSGYFGGIMLSVNTEKFYEKAKRTMDEISVKIADTNEKIKRSTEGVQTENTILAVTLVTILVVVILGIFAANSISKPIRELTRVANVISDGNVDVEIPVIKTKDEIYDLGESMKAVLAAVDFLRETLGMNEDE
jgi:HAMP domain-containing protein